MVTFDGVNKVPESVIWDVVSMVCAYCNEVCWRELVELMDVIVWMDAAKWRVFG